LAIAPSCGRFRFSREKVAGHGSNTTTGQATLHTTTTQPKQELCGIYTPEENSVKSSRFAGVSDAAAEREPAGEILSPNFGRRIPRNIAKSGDILTFSRYPGNDLGKHQERRPVMSLNLDLSPELEKRLVAQAHERGVSLSDYLQEIITREIRPSSASPSSTVPGNLSDLLINSPFAGADLNLERSRDYPRPTDLE